MRVSGNGNYHAVGGGLAFIVCCARCGRWYEANPGSRRVHGRRTRPHYDRLYESDGGLLSAYAVRYQLRRLIAKES